MITLWFEQFFGVALGDACLITISIGVFALLFVCGAFVIGKLS